MEDSQTHTKFFNYIRMEYDQTSKFLSYLRMEYVFLSYIRIENDQTPTKFLSNIRMEYVAARKTGLT